MANRRVTVGLECLAGGTDTEPPKNFALNFDLAKSTWMEMEPGSTSVVFKTKSGGYVTDAGGTHLRDAGGKDAGFLQAFNPKLAKEGDHRSDGKANETGRIFEWKVSIIA